MLKDNEAMEKKPRGEKYKGYDGVWDMVLWDDEAGLVAGMMVIGAILAVYVYWDEMVEVLLYALVGLVGLALVAGVIWFLFSHGILINPFSVESRADRLERRKAKHISKILRGIPDEELTESDLRRKDRIEASYNAKIARLMDKL